MHQTYPSLNPFSHWFDLAAMASDIGTSFFAPPAAATSKQAFSPEGSAEHRLYVPDSAPRRGAPMVVMLHGAGQDPEDFATGTGMNAAADRHGFVVLYPAQSARHNPQRCWHWFDAAHQTRTGGDPARITALALQVARDHHIDETRIFVAGLSAGGAMAALLGDLYPEVYAGVGVHSGLAARCAIDLSSGLAAMRGAPGVETAPSGMPTIVFHGDKDDVVRPINAARVIRAAIGDCVGEAREHAGSDGRRFTRRQYFRPGSARSCGEHWTLHGAAHAWSGGNAAGSYADPLGPSASEEMLRFFSEQ